MEKETRKPIENIRVGNVQAAIWENQGDKGNFMTASFSRSYEKNGEWKKAYDFSPAQLADLQRAAKEAETFIRDQSKEKGNEAMERFDARNEQSRDEQSQELER